MRIAHLSDLHLRHHLPGTASVATRRSREMPERCAAALEQIRALAPDLLALTGDLIDYPLDALDDPATQEQGRQDLQIIGDLLTALPFPVALVHGNHDHPALIDEIFGHLPNDQIVAGHRVLAFRDDEGAGHVPVRLGNEWMRFEAALADRNSLPQIHLQHYVVWPELNEEYPHTYGVGTQMREALISAGQVRLLLSGHYHRGVPLFFDKGVWFATARAFTEAPHPYNIYDIEEDEVTARTFTLPT
jgi:predicted MPP superfamily phosphohydrolase